jgi:hypothetical protein
MTPIVSRQTAKGFVEVGIDLARGGYLAMSDGKPVSLASTGIESVPELLGKPFSKAIGEALQKIGYTHCLGRRIGLYEAEAEQLVAAYRAAADADPVTLRMRREALTRAISYLLEMAHDDHVASIEQASASGRYTKPEDRAAEIEKARTELAEFDAKHPEIAAAIETDRRGSVERNMWN